MTRLQFGPTERIVVQYPATWNAGAGELVVFTPRCRLTIDDRVALHLLQLCDGSRTHEEVLLEVTAVTGGLLPCLPVDEVAGVLEDLLEAGVVGPVNALAVSAHGWGNNPQSLVRARTPEELAAQLDSRAAALRPSTSADREGRRTIRWFRCTAAEPDLGPSRPQACVCPDAELALHAVTGVTPTENRRPVPSPGALYPVSLAVLGRNGDAFTISQLMPHGDTGSGGACAGVDELEAALDDGTILGGACAVVVIGVDPVPTTYKYGSRGWRLAMLEAGGYMQAIIDAATAAGLDSYPYAGFRDTELAALLGWDVTLPVLCIGLGRRAVDVPAVQDVLPALTASQSEFVTGTLLRIPTEPAALPGALVVVTYRDEPGRTDPADCFGAGFASTTRIAELRARAEAEERHLSGQTRTERTAAARDLDGPHMLAGVLTGVDPAPGVTWLVPHTEDLVTDWVAARRARSGDQVFVPADACFYPRSAAALGRPLVAAANSSGVAAGTPSRPALPAACLELLERDAFVGCWAGLRPVQRLADVPLSGWGRRLQSYIADCGHRVELFRLPSQVPVVLAVAFRDSFPALLTGAGAHWSDPSSAAIKALEELAGSVRAFGDADIESAPSPADLRGPRDHLLFYAEPSNTQLLLSTFFASAEHVVGGDRSLWGPGVDSQAFIDEHDPLVVDLGRPGSPLDVVRVFIPGLLPIWFGSALSPHVVGSSPDRGWSALPHFFP